MWSSCKLQTNPPNRPSSPEHVPRPPRTVQRRPPSRVMAPTHTVPLRSSSMRRHEHFVELMEPGEAAVTPAGQAFKRADPEGAVTCAEQTVDARDGPLLASRAAATVRTGCRRSERVRTRSRATGSRRVSGPSRKRAPSENPSRTVHAVCAYWLTSSDGSNARRGAEETAARPRPSPGAPTRVSCASFLGHRSGAASRTGAEP